MKQHLYENELEADCTAIIKKLGGEHRKLDVGPGAKGQLDHAYWLPDGLHFIIEFKREGEYPNPKQNQRIERLLDMRHKVYIIHNYVEFMGLMTHLNLEYSPP